MSPEEPGGLSGHNPCRGLLSITTIIESYLGSYTLFCERVVTYRVSVVAL